MIYYKTYNFVAGFLLIAFSSFVGMLFFGSEPQPADAVQMPHQAVVKQMLNSDNGSSGTNLVGVDDISDGVYSINNDGDSFFTRDPLGELFPIEISADSSRSLTDPASEMDLGTESGTRIIQSDSTDASAVVADSTGSAADSTGSSGTGDSGSPGGGGSDSSGTGSSDSSGAGSSNSAGTSGSGSPGGGGFTETDDLSKLQPLPKIHYYAAMDSVYLNDYGSEVLYEIARITHSMGISGEWTTEKQVDNCVYTCARVNKTTPQIEASLSVSYSPWHRKFKPELGFGNAIPEQYNSTIFTDVTYTAEIEQFVSRLTLVKQWIAKSNAKYNTDVKASLLKFDCERFYEKPGDDEWNEALRECLDIIQIKAQEIFPEAKIQWYGRGFWKPDTYTWKKTPYFTGKEIKSPLSCALYMLPEIEYMRETYRRTCKLADELGIQTVTPYVALGCGYKRGVIKKLKWTDNWDYDLAYSHQMGAELNIPRYSEEPERYADYKRAEYIMLYPPPLYSKTECWSKHFVAYVNGATGTKN